MTRKRALSDTQIRELRAAHQLGVRGFGYGALAKQLNVGASTIRDALKGWTAYSARTI